MIFLGLRARKRSWSTDQPGWPGFTLIVPLFPLWIVGVLCTKDVPMSHIVALAGDSTYLPCDISTAEEKDSVHLVLWYREDLGTSVFSIDARDRDFNSAEKWSDEKVFDNRAYFIPNKQPAELEVHEIREEDAGIYRCRVDFEIGQTRNSKVNLTVIVPPKKVLILNETGKVQSSKVGSYKEGSTVRLFCDVYGGKPSPTVTWYRDNKFLTDKSVMVRDGVLRSSIEIKNLVRADVQSQLTCNATNNNRSTPVSTTVRLEMNLEPLLVNIVGDNQPLSAGKRYDLVCETSGSRPPARITWWKDGQQLFHSSNTTSSDGNTTRSVLSFKATKEDAGRRLLCQAENPIMNTSPIEDNWILTIRYTPETRIRLGTSLNPNAIQEGADVYFDCLIRAEPSVHKVEWRHQGATLNHNVTLGIIISNHSLVLQGVSRKSAGNYTCIGSNTEGEGESNPLYLNVKFSPTCKPNQKLLHGVAKQEKTNISCEVEANPPNVEFRWTFNNSAESIDVDAGHIAGMGTTSMVSYTPITELDYGTLLCWATNIIGEQQVPCVYHITPAGRPDMVHNCTISNTSSNSFAVRCMEGFNGGVTQSFLLEVRESNSQELQANMTAASAHFNVTQLEPGVLYHAYVYAYNEKGRSEPIVVQAGTLRLPEKQLTSESERPRHNVKLTPVLSVMIGVVAALVIVAVIVMIVLKIQNSNIDEEGKSHTEDPTKATKTAPIQRELRFREGGSLIIDEKHPSSPFRKLDTNGDISENDEKNPDIIPQQITGDEPSEYLRKRRLISTIETSPSRNVLERTTATAVGSHGNYVGYCTIRNGMPLRELSNLSSKQKSFQPVVSEVYESGVCTLPRQHWPNQSVQTMTMAVSPPVLYTGILSRTCQSSVLVPKEVESRIQGQCCIQSPKDPAMGTPVIVMKRESSV